MHRRRFLQGSAAAAVLANLPHDALGRSTAAPTDDWRARFYGALEQHPWLKGYQTASAQTFAATAALRGTVPAQLRGTLS